MRNSLSDRPFAQVLAVAYSIYWVPKVQKTVAGKSTRGLDVCRGLTAVPDETEGEMELVKEVAGSTLHPVACQALHLLEMYFRF